MLDLNAHGVIREKSEKAVVGQFNYKNFQKSTLFSMFTFYTKERKTWRNVDNISWGYLLKESGSEQLINQIHSKL